MIDITKLPPELLHKYLAKIAWRRAAQLEQRQNFAEKYPEDPIAAFLSVGKHYFDREILIARKRELINFKPARSFADGGFTIFQQRIPGRRYVCGADPATGREVNSEDTDYCAAVWLDLETGEEVAAYRNRTTPQQFAFDLEQASRAFNNAVVAVERTGDGGTVILTLTGECQYANVYKHKEWFKRERKVIEVEGFPTTIKTRPLALSWVDQFIRDYPELIWDIQFINEAMTFVRNPKGKPEAAQGYHDDTVSARWIAHAARRALMGWWIPSESSKERYTA